MSLFSRLFSWCLFWKIRNEEGGSDTENDTQPGSPSTGQAVRLWNSLRSSLLEWVTLLSGSFAWSWQWTRATQIQEAREPTQLVAIVVNALGHQMEIYLRGVEIIPDVQVAYEAHVVGNTLVEDSVLTKMTKVGLAIVSIGTGGTYTLVQVDTRTTRDDFLKFLFLNANVSLALATTLAALVVLIIYIGNPNSHNTIVRLLKYALWVAIFGCATGYFSVVGFILKRG